ncbi:hypothetical protein B0H19DRAFT_1271866 [Mycena capillaripes]|nr:hypothetical protein B0H19DRAFT_1271866 [Mycena capillaripes]
MSRANQPAQQSQRSAPSMIRRRRTLMACVCCRKRKIRCLTSEQPPVNPCARCTRKKLPCEYVSASEPDHYSSSSSSPQTPEFPSGDFPVSTPSPSPWTAPPPSPNPRIQQGGRTVRPVPYIVPPPTHYHPRYAGAHYPGLGLRHEHASMSMQPPMPTPSSYPLNSHVLSNANSADLLLRHEPPSMSMQRSMPTPSYYSLNPHAHSSTNYAFDLQTAHASQYHTVHRVPAESATNPHPLPPMPFFADTNLAHDEFDWLGELGWS